MSKQAEKLTSFQEYLQEQLQDEAFRREYEALEPEFAIMQALLAARNEGGLTQKELSERTGITQADISRLEHGNGNPSVKTLKRLAAGMGKKLQINFMNRLGPINIRIITKILPWNQGPCSSSLIILSSLHYPQQ